MDDQQGRPDADLNWLAGVWESEGWFSLSADNRRNTSRYYPIAGVVNTDADMIEEIVRVMNVNNLAFYIKERGTNTGLGAKVRYELRVEGQKRCFRLLSVLVPYLRSKKRRAEIVLAFIRSRMASESQKSPTSETEHSLYRELRGLNGRGIRGNPQRLIRQTPSTDGEDRART